MWSTPGFNTWTPVIPIVNNDLSNVSNMKTTLFADDSNFQMADKCLIPLQNKVNKEICMIDLWMKSNKL